MCIFPLACFTIFHINVIYYVSLLLKKKRNVVLGLELMVLCLLGRYNCHPCLQTY
jgi:hypothetical protein